ncbi:TetR/AcrR family transcriptional regulator [Pseudonocardia humida]|uniref:TetR/AcrR family transcriptional regulator n=1 Tax=Pseudonocardia humida TaxID=2800819 RepID=A0ABT1A447_9PSEU|nr:TetR/AcrR family transcriptional regulator [Pseudonocardia humida]MCO1657723.1 TetR/AcrR family transcriptional regulator [Pseudonocardia humida]
MDEPGTRAAIGRALLELLAEGRAVSYGATASRAGVSKGLVQHYFPDRTRLVRFAATTLAARLGERLRGAVADPATDAATTLADALVALLPATPDSRLDEAAGRALFALALTDPQTNRDYRDGRRAVAGLVRDLLAAAAPERGPGWLAATARDLLGTLAELGTDLVLGELTADEATTALRGRVRDAVA